MSVNSTTYYQHPTNVSSPEGFFLNYLNTQSGGAWGLTLVGLSFGITFLSLQGFDPRKALAAASFNGLITAIILSVFGVVGSFTYTLMTVFVAVAVLINRGGA